MDFHLFSPYLGFMVSRIQRIGAMFSQLGERSFLAGYSAVDSYLGFPEAPFTRVATEGGLIDVASLGDSVCYPGDPGIDAVLEAAGHPPLLITCLQNQIESEPIRRISEMYEDDEDSLASAGQSGTAGPDVAVCAFPTLSIRHQLLDFPGIPFFQDLRSGAFYDPCGLYPRIREIRRALGKHASRESFSAGQPADWTGTAGDIPVTPGVPGDWADAAVTAISLARYGTVLPSAGSNDPAAAPLSPLLQRELLCAVLTGRFALLGLSYLMETGFIQEHWPELSILDDVQHGKEYHPEGNVWQHTLATLRYRKTADLRISLALLLHDCGKPEAAENEGRTFDRHAQIGAVTAGRFLRRIGFSEEIVSDTVFLVAEHMLPAAVPSLPVFRAERALSSPLFPLLLEVYRCDLASTFRGPQGYYEACKAYRGYLRNSKNPFRDADGKKLVRLYVE